MQGHMLSACIEHTQCMEGHSSHQCWPLHVMAQHYCSLQWLPLPALIPCIGHHGRPPLRVTKGPHLPLEEGTSLPAHGETGRVMRSPAHSDPLGGRILQCVEEEVVPVTVQLLHISWWHMTSPATAEGVKEAVHVIASI